MTEFALRAAPGRGDINSLSEMQVWRSGREPDTPLSPFFQYAFFGGLEMNAGCDEENEAVTLWYAGVSSGPVFPTMDEAKAAAPAFAKQVLAFLSSSIVGPDQYQDPHPTVVGYATVISKNRVTFRGVTYKATGTEGHSLHDGLSSQAFKEVDGENVIWVDGYERVHAETFEEAGQVRAPS